MLKETRDAFYPTWLANELRPIYTDPSNERGIVDPKVELKDLTKKDESRGSYGRGRPTSGRDHRGGGGRDQRGGGRNFRQKQWRWALHDNDRNSGGCHWGGGGRYDGHDGNSGGYRSRDGGVIIEVVDDTIMIGETIEAEMAEVIVDHKIKAPIEDTAVVIITEMINLEINA